MGNITLGQICDAVASTLSASVADLKIVQSYDELTETIGRADMPAAQVYMLAGRCDETGDTDRASFAAGIRHKVFTVVIDVFCKQRAHIGEDMQTVVDTTDAVEDCMEGQIDPLFGDENIKAFSWTWTYEVWPFSNATIGGSRFILEVHVY